MWLFVYMSSGHGCACTSPFMHMHMESEGMLLLRYYLVSLRQESLWPRTHLIQLACSVSKLKGSSQISPRLQGPGTTPSFFFFFSHRYWGVNSDIHACTGSTLLSPCLCLVGQGFQQFRLVLNSLYSQGRIKTPDPLTSNCQKMLGLQARTNHHVGLAPKCFEYCCGIILLYTLKMSCSDC